MQKPSANSLIEALQNASLYPHSVSQIRVLETHISWVVLTGPFAYKIKKPVRLDFIDCTTLERRRFFCEEELRLNRRLAPALYLEVVPIFGPPDRPSLQPEGEVVEYAVKMRQFDQQDLLSHVIERGALTFEHIDDLIGQVSAFHHAIDPAEPESPFGEPELIDRQAGDNFPPVRQVLQEAAYQNVLDDLEAWFASTFAARQKQFAHRKAEGRIRECHGDMHLGNMLLWEGRVVIFDGIDFNEQLRWIDVAAEVAFVVMDLEDRGFPEGAHRFLNGYLEQTGDYDQLQVLPYYLAYRAMVRAKVAATRLQQLEAGAEATDDLQHELHSYLDLARRYTNRSSPHLLLTYGLSGTGKSYGTQRLLESSGAIRIRSDVERKRLYGLQPLDQSDERLGMDMYSPEATRRTYDRLAALARQILEAGYSVIVDATFLRERERAIFRQLARAIAIPLTILDFQASLETLRARITSRQEQGADASEAGLDILEKQLADRDPLTEVERQSALTLNTESTIDWDAIGQAIWGPTYRDESKAG